MATAILPTLPVSSPSSSTFPSNPRSGSGSPGPDGLSNGWSLSGLPAQAAHAAEPSSLFASSPPLIKQRAELGIEMGRRASIAVVPQGSGSSSPRSRSTFPYPHPAALPRRSSGLRGTSLSRPSSANSSASASSACVPPSGSFPHRTGPLSPSRIFFSRPGHSQAWGYHALPHPLLARGLLEAHGGYARRGSLPVMHLWGSGDGTASGLGVENLRSRPRPHPTSPLSSPIYERADPLARASSRDNLFQSDFSFPPRAPPPGSGTLPTRRDSLSSPPEFGASADEDRTPGEARPSSIPIDTPSSTAFRRPSRALPPLPLDLHTPSGYHDQLSQDLHSFGLRPLPPLPPPSPAPAADAEDSFARMVRLQDAEYEATRNAWTRRFSREEREQREREARESLELIGVTPVSGLERAFHLIHHRSQSPILLAPPIMHVRRRRERSATPPYGAAVPMQIDRRPNTAPEQDENLHHQHRSFGERIKRGLLSVGAKAQQHHQHASKHSGSSAGSYEPPWLLLTRPTSGPSSSSGSSVTDRPAKALSAWLSATRSRNASVEHLHEDAADEASSESPSTSTSGWWDNVPAEAMAMVLPVADRELLVYFVPCSLTSEDPTPATSSHVSLSSSLPPRRSRRSPATAFSCQPLFEEPALAYSSSPYRAVARFLPQPLAPYPCCVPTPTSSFNDFDAPWPKWELPDAAESGAGPPTFEQQQPTIVALSHPPHGGLEFIPEGLERLGLGDGLGGRGEEEEEERARRGQGGLTGAGRGVVECIWRAWAAVVGRVE